MWLDYLEYSQDITSHYNVKTLKVVLSGYRCESYAENQCSAADSATLSSLHQCDHNSLCYSARCRQGSINLCALHSRRTLGSCSRGVGENSTPSWLCELPLRFSTQEDRVCGWTARRTHYLLSSCISVKHSYLSYFRFIELNERVILILFTFLFTDSINHMSHTPSWIMSAALFTFVRRSNGPIHFQDSKLMIIWNFPASEESFIEGWTSFSPFSPLKQQYAFIKLDMEYLEMKALSCW